MDDAADTPHEPTRQALAIPGRSSPGRVTGKLRKALDAMVWEAKTRDEAAEAADLAVHSLREALKKPHVKRYYLDQLDVLRTSERPRNIHALIRVRDTNTNGMAVVQAVKALEQIEDAQVSQRSHAPSPGVVIVIEQRSDVRDTGVTIEHE